MTIEAYVSELFGIEEKMLYAKGQTRDVVYPRDVCMYYRVKIFIDPLKNRGQSLREAAAEYNKDHATASHAIKKIDGFIETYPKWRTIINDIKKLSDDGKISPDDEPMEEERLIMNLQ